MQRHIVSCLCLSAPLTSPPLLIKIPSEGASTRFQLINAASGASVCRHAGRSHSPAVTRWPLVTEYGHMSHSRGQFEMSFHLLTIRFRWWPIARPACIETGRLHTDNMQPHFALCIRRPRRRRSQHAVATQHAAAQRRESRFAPAAFELNFPGAVRAAVRRRRRHGTGSLLPIV